MRVGFEGEGPPIPIEALPGASDLGELPTQTLRLTEEGFKAEDYVGLGYTHYEVMCIGAVGGRGGDHFPTEYIFGGDDYHDSIGGGGGGGGLHVVSGLLAALPALVPVVIGQPGADGIDLRRNPDDFYGDFLPPEAGEDGGYSSFNGDTCMASGGKGGYATPQGTNYPPQWTLDPTWSAYFRPGGKGGEGGVGGQTEAGGGGEGGEGVYTPGDGPNGTNGQWSYSNGEDGSWNGAIGQGGGGGSGGTKIVRFSTSSTVTTRGDILYPATPGGLGSFSYGDPSVSGPRGSRSLIDLQPYHNANNQTDFQPIVPGTGGGAKPVSLLPGFGSRAQGCQPQGAVLIRLRKLT